MKTIMHGAMAFGLALTLAACGGGDGDDGDDQVGATPLQNGFGPGFQAAFNSGAGADDGLAGGSAGAVDATVEPIDPGPGDLIALSLTTDPVDVP